MEDGDVGKHHTITALEAYAYVHPDTVEPKEVMQGLSAESDRAAIIICSSLIEEALKDAIVSKLRKLSNTERKDLKLFEPLGLISTFSQKVDMAYAMDLIDRPMWRFINHLRLIRNCCSHAFKPMDLDAVPVLRAACETLFRDEWRALVSETFQQTPSTLRQAMISECVALTKAIKDGRESARDSLRQMMEEIHRENRERPDA